MVSILIDDEILLRSYQPDDAPACSRPSRCRPHLSPWLNWVGPTTKQEHTANFIQHSIQQLHSQEGLALGIFHKQQIIGGMGMHQWDHAIKKAQIGYWISRSMKGKGSSIPAHKVHRFPIRKAGPE